jgi:glycosyltransferase involved in cell wall biosynthesis
VPFFSITIPAYNVTPYLRECLDSVLSQSFIDWEAICIDDGSTDETGAILDEYAKKDTRLRVFHQENAGVSNVRQKALELSCGKYLISIDPDDYVEKDFLHGFFNVIGSDSVDVVWSDFKRLSANGKLKLIVQDFEADETKLMKSMLTGIMHGGMCNKAVSIDFIKRSGVKFAHLPWSEDLVFLYELFLHKAKLKYLPEGRYIYRYRVGSLVSPPAEENDSRRLKDDLTVEEYVSNLLLKIGWDDIVLFRKKHLKFSVMINENISDRDFMAVYPEITDVAESSLGAIKTFFFFLAVHGFRKEVLFILKCRRAKISFYPF